MIRVGGLWNHQFGYKPSSAGKWRLKLQPSFNTFFRLVTFASLRNFLKNFSLLHKRSQNVIFTFLVFQIAFLALKPYFKQRRVRIRFSEIWIYVDFSKKKFKITFKNLPPFSSTLYVSNYSKVIFFNFGKRDHVYTFEIRLI